MHGTNPIRPPVKGDGSTLDVVEMFPTLQGEGPFAGQPSVFVRLGGCNLACSFCDTEFEDFRPIATEDIVRDVKFMAAEDGARVRELVVITGGEPLRQPIGPLCDALLEEGFSVQIETNGTLWRPLPEQVHIVCSPKASGGSYHPIRTDVLSRAQALKFLISAEDAAYADVVEVGQSAYDLPVYVQPIDAYDEAKNKANLAKASALAAQHGYHLSLQMHKIWGIR